MGRSENRKAARYIKKRMTEEQFNSFQDEVNSERIKQEVEKQVKFYQDLWSECITESFKKNGYSLDKAKMILDDVELIMLRKINDKKKNKAGQYPVVKGRL